MCVKEGACLINGFKIAAVCTAKVHEEYVLSFLDEFNRILSDNGWRVFAYTVNSDLYYKTGSDHGEAAVFDLIDYDRTDAVVLFRNNILDDSVNESITERTEKHGIRLVMIDYKRKGCINMLFDYDNGFRQMVRHLFDVHKVRDIRMIAGNKGMESSEIRINAVRELANERGIEFDGSRISYGDYWSGPAKKACESFIADGSLPEAVICGNDTMAIAVCGTLRDHGIRVPEDVIVTGFDGIEESKYTYPKISTVKCDFGKMGRACAQTLLDPDTQEKDIYIMPDIIPSEYCGCVESSAVDVAKVLTLYWDTFDRYRNDERKLNLISSKVQGCSGLDEVETELTNRVFYELTCVLKKEVTDPTFDPLTINTDTTFGKDMAVLLDTDESYIGRERGMDISQVIPRLDDVFEQKTPLIFTSLHYIDIPLGYICFHYASPTGYEFNKIAQTSGYICSAVSGYRNMRYQHRLREWIEEVYRYDELTGLYTRKSFIKEYERMLEENAFTEMTLVLCDLDGLKYINDNFGHSEGDMAIRVVAKAMEIACEGGICSKHGGDELLGAVPKALDPDRIKADIERFISDYNEASEKPYTVSSSIGIYVAKGGDLSFSKLFAQADDLMYIDKVRKKNTRAAIAGE